MKHFMFACFILITFISCAANRSIVSVPANQNILIDGKGYDQYEATIKNKSFLNLEVEVIDNNTKKTASGFGLGKKAKVDLVVGKGKSLYIFNKNQKAAKLKIAYRYLEAAEVVDLQSTTDYVSFTLANNTAKSIPLIIPTVMNPNLSPFSKSGVDLKYGQKVYFKANSKRHVLLIVDDKIKDGDIIKVGALLKKRKQDLGI